MATDNKFFSFGRVSVQNSLYVNGNTSVQNGRLTVGDNSTDASIVAQGSGSIIVPVGSSFERPASAITGMVRFNSSTNSLEFWNPNPGTWTGVVSATGGDYNLDTVKFDLTDDQLTDFSSLEAAFSPTSDVLPADAVFRSDWTLRATPATEVNWTSLAYNASIIVAVGSGGLGLQRVMTSTNGTSWTLRNAANDNNWSSVTWAEELDLFVAVANSGPVSGARVMTSANGITWVPRTAASDNSWSSITWAAGLERFVAVASSGTGNRVMTSSDGITWDIQSSAADNAWTSVTWADELGLFVAVANSGTGNRVMTSSDGISWDIRSSAANNAWSSVTWASELGLLVAVANSGVGNRIMTSYDGINWATRTSPADLGWNEVTWSAQRGVFVAVASASQIMYSSNGIDWFLGPASELREWNSVVWVASLNLFVAVTLDEAPNLIGAPNKIMTSTFPSDSKFAGGCLSKNNDMYFIPGSAYNVLVYDTIDRSTRTIDLTSLPGFSLTSVDKWVGCALTPTDVIVAAPFNTNAILTIATADAEVVSTVEVPSDILNDVTGSFGRWSNCTTTPNNSLVYFAPGTARRIMTMDYTTMAVSSIVLPEEIQNLPGIKFQTSVLGADRNIYMFPRDSPTVILKIDTRANTVSAILKSFPPNPDSSTTWTWFGGVLGPDRKIYVTPVKNRNVLEFDPITSTLVVHQLPLSPLVNFGTTFNWINAALGQNGKVYAFPFASQVILEFDPINKVATYIPLPNASRYTTTSKFVGAVMGPDNSLYTVPRSENVIMELSFIKGTAYKSWMLSPYFNRC